MCRLVGARIRCYTMRCNAEKPVKLDTGRMATALHLRATRQMWETI